MTSIDRWCRICASTPPLLVFLGLDAPLLVSLSQAAIAMYLSVKAEAAAVERLWGSCLAPDTKRKRPRVGQGLSVFCFAIWIDLLVSRELHLISNYSIVVKPLQISYDLNNDRTLWLFTHIFMHLWYSSFEYQPLERENTPLARRFFTPPGSWSSETVDVDEFSFPGCDDRHVCFDSQLWSPPSLQHGVDFSIKKERHGKLPSHLHLVKCDNFRFLCVYVYTYTNFF